MSIRKYWHKVYFTCAVFAIHVVVERPFCNRIYLL